MKNRILFRKLKKYKYQLGEDYIHPHPMSRLKRYLTGKYPEVGSSTGRTTVHQHNKIGGFASFAGDDKLYISKGYAWDGPSGPTIDTDNFMRGSLLHDALYQMIREGILTTEARKYADQQLIRTCIEDGMGIIRATYVYWFVRLFGFRTAKPNPSLQIWDEIQYEDYK